MLRILDLPKQFRPKTSVTYPPFKNGRYMEEYFYDFYLEELQKQQDKTNESTKGQVVYIPVFWTNIQNHPGFAKNKQTLSLILTDKLLKYDKENNTESQPIKYFTVVQHDDGIQLDIPKKVRDKLTIFGACTGDIPLPLIYEDTTNRIDRFWSSHWPKTPYVYLASFVGSETHLVRRIMTDKIKDNPKIGLQSSKSWTNSVSESAADKFLDMTIKSEFCLAPRGYGRSSFRFFEAIELNVIPVYIWDDVEWLPYKDFLNYEEFSLSINVKDIDKLVDTFESIYNTKTYSSMKSKLLDVKLGKYFTLEFMGHYVLYTMGIGKIEIITNTEIIEVPVTLDHHQQVQQ